MSGVIPEIVVSDIELSTRFYTTLGFTKEDEGIVDEKGSQWNSMAMGDAHVWLLRQDVAEATRQGEARGNGVTLYLSVDDVDATHDALKKAGLQINIVKELETQWYGLREFRLADPDGYIWTINSPVSQEAAEATGETDEPS